MLEVAGFESRAANKLGIEVHLYSRGLQASSSTILRCSVETAISAKNWKSLHIDQSRQRPLLRAKCLIKDDLCDENRFNESWSSFLPVTVNKLQDGTCL